MTKIFPIETATGVQSVSAPRFELNFLSEHSDEALIAELRRVASLLDTDKPMSRVSYERRSPKVSYSTIQRRFGGWAEALARAGLAQRRSKPLSDKVKFQIAKRMSKDEVLAELKRVHALVQTPWLTTDAFNAQSSIEEGAIRRHFGTFRKGLEAAGIPSHPLAVRPLTDQECFENVADVWTHHGRAPQYREMFQPPSHIRGKTYVTRWKTWRKALIAFVTWANADEKQQPESDTEREPNTVEHPETSERLTEADRREIRPGLRFRVFRRDLFRCVACGRSPATHLKVELHADHIVAVSNGGRTTFENLQTLCQDCNLGKGKS
jgi:hypothetical protein